MKSGLEVIIRGDGFVLSHDRGRVVEEIGGAETDVGAALADFCERQKIGTKAVNVFLSEDLVYLASLELPLKTPSIREAISFQLGMLLPFPEEDVLYSYSAARKESTFKVMIYAARARQVVVSMEELTEAGFAVRGLFPENQRYVTARARKMRWALVVPGKLNKIFIFDGIKLDERILCREQGLSHSSLKELCETGNIYHISPPIASGFNPARQLLESGPVLKEYNMLPASYRRPDYLKMAMISLLILNAVCLVVLGGVNFIAQGRQIQETDSEITRLMPLVRKVNETKEQIRQAEVFLEQAAGMGGNPEVFAFLEKLTMTLPAGSYLDQLLLDAGKRTVTINGYTANIGELTENLQGVGEARLKSTSRRKNMTYFQVEISLP